MSESDAPPTGEPHADQPAAEELSFIERAEAQADAVADRFDKSDWIELLSALLLALATIAAAWCAYQSTRWGGVQADAYAQAGAVRQESVRASSRSSALSVVDVQVFQSWVEARNADDERLAGFYRERFRAEFVPAFEAWLASAPAGTIPPGTPFSLPDYQLAEQVRADELASQAEAFTAQAQEANQIGDNFVLLAVIFASVLFFAGVGTKFRGYRVRVTMVAFATLMFGLAMVFVAILPQDVGI